MAPLRIFLGDLTHDTLVLVSDTIPINIGFIGSYAKKIYGADVDIAVFKYPQEITHAIAAEPPDVLALSNYSWNSRLSERVAAFAKTQDRKILTVQGGTNFPHRTPEQLEFVRSRPATDIFVELEAELSFSELVGRVLGARDGGPGVFDTPIPGCVFIVPSTRSSAEPVLVKGALPPRIKNLDEIPSPYLSGLLDRFFDGRLTPFLETNRGCPFKCTFCHTGADYFQKLNTFSLDRVTEEIAYIAPRASALGIVNLHLADTNFGMYERDRAICQALLQSQQEHGWPRQIMATTGKNNKERVIEITEMMGNVFSVNMSVQSMDKDVLVHIKRSNIRLDDYIKINQSLRESGRSTKGEVIIGLPGETRESFVRGLAAIIGGGVTSVCCYTLMLLHGTEFKDPVYRKAFEIQGRYRIVPLDFGEYAGERVFDTEEVGIATRDMSFDDYLWIRGLCLVVEIIHNNRAFEELVRYARAMGVTRFDLIQRAYERIDGAPVDLRQLVRGFLDETRSELWGSDEELMAFYARDENYARLLAGDAGGNLIYKYKAVSLAFASRAWAEFLGTLLREMFFDRVGDCDARGQATAEIDTLVEYVQNKLAGVLDANGDSTPRTMNASADILAWLRSAEGTPLSAFSVGDPLTYVFEYTDDQRAARADYFSRYGTSPSALSKIVTRVSNVESLFRRVRASDQQNVEPATEGDEFIRYTLSN